MLNDIQVQAEELELKNAVGNFCSLQWDVFPRAFEFGLRADPIMHLKPGTKFYWHLCRVSSRHLFRWDPISSKYVALGVIQRKSWKAGQVFSGFIGLILIVISKTWPPVFPDWKARGDFMGFQNVEAALHFRAYQLGVPMVSLVSWGRKAVDVMVWLHQLAAEDAAMSHSRLFLEPWGTSPSTDKVLFNLAWINARTLSNLFNLSLQFACLENWYPPAVSKKKWGG